MRTTHQPRHNVYDCRQCAEEFMGDFARTVVEGLVLLDAIEARAYLASSPLFEPEQE